MVKARLHIICGNCGCNDEWDLEVLRDYTCLGDGKFEDTARLICNNCLTRHYLDEYRSEK